MTCLLAMAAAFLSAGGVTTLRAEGVSEGVGPHARSAAIEIALEEAVRQAVDALALEGVEDMRAALLQNPRAYVVGFQTLRVTTEGGETTARVRAHVDSGALEAAFVQLAASHLREPPRVVALIGHAPEDGLLRVGAELPAQKAVEGMLAGERFDLVPFEELAERHGAEALREALQEGPEALALIARQHWAQAIVAGRATWRQEERGEGLYRTEAEASLRVIRVWDAEELAHTNNSQRMHSANPAEGRDSAVAEAALRARDAITQGCILASLGAAQSEDAEVRVAGASPGQLESVIEAILDAPEVYGVEEMAPHGDTAVLRVYYEESMAGLARSITGRDYAGFQVRIERALGREMTLTVE